MQHILFPLILFLSAVLLFSIQPMVAKNLLPLYGGAPAVWTICMLFFQMALLIGYSYAYLISRIKEPRWARSLHMLLCLLSLLFLPIDLLTPMRRASPEFDILISLLSALGLPLLVISASAPLFQFFYSQTKARDAKDPYYLYVASNLGSLIILFAYPWIIERYLSLIEQFVGWNWIYCFYLVIAFFILLFYRFEALPRMVDKPNILPWKPLLYWTFLSFVPCNLMLSLTFYMTSDVASTPMFWVIPLGLYLLSFVITFAKKPLISHQWVENNSLLCLSLVFILVVIFNSTYYGNWIWLILFINLATFFIFALLFHGKLAILRPEPLYLTQFYFCLALGGALAGIFNGLIAPKIFVGAYEYPLAILFCIACISIPLKKGEWKPVILTFIVLTLNEGLPTFIVQSHIIEIFVFGFVILFPRSARSLFGALFLVFLSIYKPWTQDADVLSQARNFYGIKRVENRRVANLLISQTTMHGLQIKTQPENGAVGYYGAVYPLVEAVQAQKQAMNALIIGLGTGTMACQFREQDKLTFIEIDEQVIKLAKNPRLFSFLSICKPRIEVLQEDGRLGLASLKDSYDLIAMDAFSSDSIPIHMLTLEAFELYKKKIKADGVILIHISNRFLNLLPVITVAAKQLNLKILFLDSSHHPKLAQMAARWVMLTSNETLFQLMLSMGWKKPPPSNLRVWTDNYSNLIPLLNF